MRRLLSGSPKGASRTQEQDPSGDPGSRHGGISGKGRSGSRRYDPAWDDWKPQRRWPGVVASCCVVLVFLAAVIWYERPQPAAHAKGKGFDIPAKAAYVPDQPRTGGSVTTFTGKASKSGLIFNASGTLTILHASCTCLHNFVVTVAAPNGAALAYPVNEVGLYDAVMPITVPAGRDRLSVIGSGPWTIQVIQPDAATRQLATPFSYLGRDPSVLGPFSAANHFLSFKFVPGGSEAASVAVTALDLQGHDLLPFGAPILTASTYFEKTETLGHLSNPFYLEIASSGIWYLKIQRSSAG